MLAAFKRLKLNTFEGALAQTYTLQTKAGRRSGSIPPAPSPTFQRAQVAASRYQYSH